MWTDFKALEDLLKSDFELSLTPRHQQLLVEGMMAKTSSKLYYLCAGPEFEIGFPFDMVEHVSASYTFYYQF